MDTGFVQYFNSSREFDVKDVVFRHPPAHRARLVVLIPWEAVGGAQGG